MSKLSDEYLKILEDIEKNISNEEERKYVSKKISELSSIYLDIIERISEVSMQRIDEIDQNQEKIEEKVSKIKETVDLIKSDIYEDDGYDFEIVCPYCNHEFVADVEAELKEEIECPECHNIIELDWDGDDEEEGCNGCCSGCGHHSPDCEDNIEDEDDDM
jgi:DNA repair exonuclease SbcCD ATPase subunit